MKNFFKVFLPMLLLAQSAMAESPVQRQDAASIRQAVEQFLKVQTTGLPGQINVAAGQVDQRLNLPVCAALEPFLPSGSRAWGRTTVGVRCTTPTNWTVYVPATVQVIADYVATAVPLAQGQMIGPSDVLKIKGDLASLPAGILTDPAQAIGRTAAISLGMGIPLRQDSVRTQQAIHLGQSVRLVSAGPGFKVSTEAQALANAMEGQVIQARTPAGQVISGVARTGGVVEVSY